MSCDCHMTSINTPLSGRRLVLSISSQPLLLEMAWHTPQEEGSDPQSKGN